MKLLQDFPGYNRRTDDPARLHLAAKQPEVVP